MNNRRLYILAVIAAVVCMVCVMIPINKSGSQEIMGISEPKEVNSASEDVPAAEQKQFPQPESTSYQMGLYLDIEKRTLRGLSLIDSSNTTENNLKELWFTMYPNAFKDQKTTPAPPRAYFKGFDPGWIDVSQIKVNGKKAEYHMEGISMQVIPPDDLKPQEEFRIEVEWTVKIPKLAYRFGSQGTTFMLGNFYPALNLLDENGWHRSYNSKFGDPFCLPSADYLVQVNIPEAYAVASGGSIMQTAVEDSGRATYLITAGKVRDFCLLVMYDYSEIKATQNNVTINCFMPSRYDPAIGSEIVNVCHKIMNYYSCRWGSYTYPEFKIVLVPMEGFQGMEFSSMIFLREDLFTDGFDLKRCEFLLAHEIAHQWWYGMVGNDQLLEPWLDEGLANWSANEYLENAHGNSGSSQRYSGGYIRLNRELKEFSSSQEYYSTAYDEGSKFWTALETELGKDVVDKVLRTYLGVYKNQIASTQELMEIIKKESPEGQDMTPFLQKWVQ